VSVVDRQVRNEALRFGLPLMLNGIGLTALSQADRIIVSNLLGLIMLASYSLTVGLAIIPISVISIVLTKILMAFIARSLAEPSDASQHTFIAGWLPCIVGAAYALCIGALLDVAVPLVYGRHFQVSVGAHALITLIVFMRICRIGPTSVLLAHGQTYKVTAANLTAAVGLVIGFLLALSLRRMEAVIFGLLLGDTFALVAMLYFTRSRMPISAVLQHLAWLFVPALAAAASSFARSGFEAEIRCAVTLVGTIWVGLDVTFAYRQRVRRFLLA
jgi:O-antigen/teichoic acid export membrane protein